MSFNVPTYETKNFSFGPGILKAGLYNVVNGAAAKTGSTPAIDIGLIDEGPSLQFQSPTVDVVAGSARVPIDTFKVGPELVQLNIPGIEWNLTNLARVLNGTQMEDEGATVQNPKNIVQGATTTVDFFFGNSINTQKLALTFQHITPVGGTIELRMWKAVGVGEIEIAMGAEKHEHPLAFKALRPDLRVSAGNAPVNWGGKSLGWNQQLVHVRRVLHPRETLNT